MEAREEELAHPEEQAEDVDPTAAAATDKTETAEDKVRLHDLHPNSYCGSGFGAAQKETR